MSEKNNKKRERGANYTPEEKSLLVDLIMRYKTIIEDKSTGGHILNKKKEAWKDIVQQYNSNAVTGTRQIEQLKALYDNMKQKSRKNVGERNKMEYISQRSHQIQENNIQDEQFNVTQNDVAIILENLREDRVQMHKTGGGFYTPKVTDTDAKILSIIQDQIEPLSNPHDSGAEYFKDVDLSKLPTLQVDLQTPLPSTSFYEKTIQSQDINSAHIILNNQKHGEDQQKPNDRLKKPSKHQTNVRKVKNVAVQKKKIKKPTSAEALKRMYFKKKCQNACLERKHLMNIILCKKHEMLHQKEEHNLRKEEHNFIKEEHNLKIILLKKKIENVNKS